MKENDYCRKCGKPLKIEQLKKLEQNAKATDVLQEMIKQELEKRGVDLGDIARILATKN